MEVIYRMKEQIQALRAVRSMIHVIPDTPVVQVQRKVDEAIALLEQTMSQIQEIYDDQCNYADALRIEVDELIEEVNQLTYELGDLQTEHEESILDDRTI